MSKVDQLLQASMPAEAHREEPMTVADLDAHIDGPRIWRTIVAVKEHFVNDPDEIKDRKDSKDEERGETVKRVRVAFDTFVENGFQKVHFQELVTELDALEEELGV